MKYSHSSLFLIFSTLDRHAPALCTGLHLLPVDLCSPLLGPAESLQSAYGETGGCLGGIQVREQGEGILPGADLLLSGRVSGESRVGDPRVKRHWLWDLL